MPPTTVTARAPGRVNLIGEHLDYNGGRCLPIAVDLATITTVSRSADGHPRYSSDAAAHGWTAYVSGVLAALGVGEPLEITVTSDLPTGAGLASSAALECSIALAVDTLLDLGLSRDDLMMACIRAENDYVGVPTGGMDQATSLFAEQGHALRLDFADSSRHLVPFDPGSDQLTLLVIDTRVSHALVDGAYAARRADCDAAAEALRITHLAYATAEQIEGLPGGRLGRRARHVASEQERVIAFEAALGVRDWATVGALMTASHVSLRDDYEVSCPELDLAVETANSAGALGARMTGGGFGGRRSPWCLRNRSRTSRLRSAARSPRTATTPRPCTGSRRRAVPACSKSVEPERYLSSAELRPRIRRATISCWICWVPSKMSRILESRPHFSSRSVSE